MSTVDAGDSGARNTASTPTGAPANPLSVGAAPPSPPALDYADRSLRPGRPWGKGFLALGATLLVWGLGHLLAGERRRAAMWFLAMLALTFATYIALAVPGAAPALIVLVPLCGVLSLAVLVDAFRCGRRSARPMLGRAWVRYVAGAALIALALMAHPGALPAKYLRDHYVEGFSVSTGGMAPTLGPGDRFLAHKRLAGPVRRWDVVVFDPPHDPGKRYLSRVVGLPGETVEIVNNRVTINGQPVDTPAGPGPYEGKPRWGGRNGTEGHPMVMGGDEYFVLGDNSPVAGDSRYWTTPAPGHQAGALPRGHIKGRVTAIYWPVARWRMFESAE